MHDAISLANYIHVLSQKPTVEEITTAFKAYKDERITWVMEADESSKVFKTMTSSVSFLGNLHAIVVENERKKMVVGSQISFIATCF